MRGFEAGVAHRRDDAQPYIEVWDQPFLRKVVAQTYHVWEVITEPLFKPLSRLHQHLFGKDEEYVPLVNRRDIRCYYLEHKGRVALAYVNITPDQYKAVSGRRFLVEQPRIEIEPTEVLTGEIV